MEFSKCHDLATVIRYADCIKPLFQTSRRRLWPITLNSLLGFNDSAMSNMMTVGDCRRYCNTGYTSLKDRDRDLFQSCPRVGWTRGSGRVGSGHDYAGFCLLAGRVGSGQHFGFFSFLLITSWYLNRYESSNTTFGVIHELLDSDRLNTLYPWAVRQR